MVGAGSNPGEPIAGHESGARVRALAAVAALVFSLAGAGPAGSTDELGDLKQRIREGKAGLDRVRSGESSVLEVLDGIDATLAEKRQRLDTLNSRLRQRERDVDDAKRAVNEASRAFEEGQGALAGRVRALYRWQRAGTPFVLLNGEFSMIELMRRKRHLETVLSRDRALIGRLSQNVRRSRGLKARVEARRRELSEQRDAVAALRDELKEERARKQATLQTLRGERALRERALDELKQAARRLQGIISGSGKGGGPAPSAPATAPRGGLAGGSLELPVTAGRIVSGFGIHKHPDLNVDVHRPGIDIVAPAGAEIRAVAGGRVLYADRLSGYGKMLILDHGRRYYTVYGHLSRLAMAVGDRVTRGERIAWAGETPSSGQSRLYFEVRKNGKPVDPVPWFRRSAVRRR